MLQVCKYPGICFTCSTYHGALNIYCSQSHGPEHTCEMYLNDFGTTGDLLSIFRGFSRQLFAYFSFFKVMALYSICCFDMAGMPWIFCILCDLFNYFRGILGHNMTVCALGWGTVILSYQCGGVFGQVASCARTTNLELRCIDCDSKLSLGLRSYKICSFIWVKYLWMRSRARSLGKKTISSYLRNRNKPGNCRMTRALCAPLSVLGGVLELMRTRG